MELGGCFCGAIRYSIDDGNYVVANCHCSMCRRISAAPFVSWKLIPKSAFRYTLGTPVELTSSATGLRQFCGNCGTPLTFWSQSRPDKLDITVCSLDHPERCVPSLDVYEETRLPWLAQTLVQELPESGAS